jgi:hypothetical protein
LVFIRSLLAANLFKLPWNWGKLGLDNLKLPQVVTARSLCRRTAYFERHLENPLKHQICHAKPGETGGDLFESPAFGMMLRRFLKHVKAIEGDA